MNSLKIMSGVMCGHPPDGAWYKEKDLFCKIYDVVELIHDAASSPYPYYVLAEDYISNSRVWRIIMKEDFRITGPSLKIFNPACLKK